MDQFVGEEPDGEVKVEIARDFDSTPFKYVDTLSDLEWLCDHLGKNNRSRVREIAVDLEHHSYRSFLGFTCLMQISTRTEDFVIDAIKLRSEMHRLNELFTDFTLVKVLHGADFDIEWLQKDFGIYVVNMFDTGQASRALLYPHFSLSYLLQRFCNVNAQKQYQLADWRQRPLNDALIRYAREDTHYLLSIYDQLRAELVVQHRQLSPEVSPLLQVYDKSKQICKKVYKKPLFYSKSFLSLCQNNSHLNPRQTKALHDLCAWRDKTARENDENCEYVLKNHQLLKIAELLPREIYGILALCNPISSYVQANVHEIHEIVRNARDCKETAINNAVGGLGVKENGPSTVNGQKSVLDSVVHLATFDPDSVLNCPHDFRHKNNDETNDNMDTNQAPHEESVIHLNLKEIFIKPTLSLGPSLPKTLVNVKSSTLNEVFSKKLALQQKRKAKRDIEEKVKKIKVEIENPFEVFLPLELRSTNVQSFKWNLVKPSEILAKPVISKETKAAKEAEEEVKTQETNMIPLKNQFRQEKFANSEKKLKKKLKSIDLAETIVEYNRIKSAQAPALGDEEAMDEELESQQRQINSLIEEKVNSNLKLLSQSLKSGTEFSYEADAMNQMFSKPQKPARADYDPASKLKRSNFAKVNKRRQTNAVTRAKQNQSVTFKTTDN